MASPGSAISPASPRVAVTRWTSQPSAAYLASVPPVPNASSSGWAKTAISVLALKSVTVSLDLSAAVALDE